jgi:predicted permease
MAADQLITFSLDPPLNGYTSERTRQFAQATLDRLNRTPGVMSAAIGTRRLLEGNRWATSVTIAGYAPEGDRENIALGNAISAGYFKTTGIGILMGRDFDARDFRTGAIEQSPAARRRVDFRVAIANEKFVKRYLGTGNPIGRRIGFGSAPGTPTPIEIVGVTQDAKYTDVRDETQEQLFFPYFEQEIATGFTAFVRTTRDTATMLAALRETMRELDPNLPLNSPRTLATQVDYSLSRERMVATMSAVFGGLATLLAVVGLYGVMAYTVSRRTREIGIRMALGARVSNIGWLVLREVLTIAAIGVTIGLPAAWWLSRYVASQLYGVQPTDPLTIAGAVLLLVAVAAVAGLAPSIRATRVSPTTALRYE